MTDSIPPASTASGAVGPTITNHVLTIPHAQYPCFLTQIVHLHSNTGSSLFVHCSSISSITARSLLPTQLPASNSATSSEDAAIDAELEAALAAAGRPSQASQASRISATQAGSLASDLALAMCPLPANSTVSYRREATGTPISTTTVSAATSSLAGPISKRIALKLSLPQLFLSLDLPPPLLPAPGRIQSPEDSRALMALEKALRDACASTLNTDK